MIEICDTSLKVLLEAFRILISKFSLEVPNRQALGEKKVEDEILPG